MKKFKMSVNGHWYEVEIKDLDASPISVLVDGEPYEVELEPEAVEGVREGPAVSVLESAPEASGPALRQGFDRLSPAAQDAAIAAGEVVAPMPGKILAVNVGVGDRVQYRDVLCILEAMKMENEIMASADGVVKEVGAVAGQDVLHGDVLFVIG